MKNLNKIFKVVILVVAFFLVTNANAQTPLSIPTATITVDGNIGDWGSIPPMATDPQGDASALYSGDDIIAIYLAKDATNLYIRMDLWDNANPSFGNGPSPNEGRYDFEIYSNSATYALLNVGVASYYCGQQWTMGCNGANGNAPISFYGTSFVGVNANVIEIMLPLADFGNPTEFYMFNISTKNCCVPNYQTLDSCIFGSLNITCQNPPTPVINANGPTTFCDGGSVTLNTGLFSQYLWSTGSTTDSIHASATGTYSVTVTNANGCTGTDSIDVTVNANPTPVITPSGSTTLCFGYNGILTLDAGSGYASYNWNPSSTDETITATGGGYYYVYIVDSNDCHGSAQILVTVNQPTTISIIPSGPTSICQGSNITLNAGAGYSTYYWYGVASASTDETVSAGIAGDYQVQVTDANGCISLGDIFVTVIPNPTPAIIPSGPTTFCDGNVTLDAGSFSSYTWSNGSTNESITVSATGTYIVTVSDVTGCTGTASQGITSTATGNSWVQKADFGGTARVNAVGFSIGTKGYIGTGYDLVSIIDRKDFWEWDQSTNAWTQKADFGGVARAGAVGFSIGTKGYIGTGRYLDDFWEWDQATNTWTQKANFGGSGRDVAVGFSIGTKGYIGTGTDVSNAQNQDFWEYDPATDIWTQKANFGGGVRQVATGFSIGSKGYIGTGAYLNFGWVDCIDFWEYDQTNDTWTQKANVGGVAREQCKGFSIGTKGYIGTGIDVITSQFHDDFWEYDQNNDTWTQKANYSGGARFDAVGFSIGSKGYITTGTDNTNHPIDFWEYSPSSCPCTSLTPTITATGPTTFCDGGSVTLDAGTYTTFIWNTGATTESISVINGGAYVVTVTDSNGCTGTASVVVTVNSFLAPTITPNGPTEFCQGGSVSLDAGNFISYSWSNGETTNPITVSTTGTYVVTVSDNNGCSGTASQDVTVHGNPIASIVPDGPTTFCSGGSVGLDAGSATTYHWSTGATTEFVTISQTGNYRVTITNSDGCTATASQLVNVNANPSPSITGGSTTFCEGGLVTLDAGLFSSYSWSNGGTDETIDASASGTYMVTVMNSNGCVGSASQVVTVNANPVPTITPNGATTFCQGGSVMLDAGTFTSYQWSGGETTQSILANTTGNFMVTVTDGNGCIGVTSLGVTVNANPTVAITANGQTSFCTGGSVTLDAGSWANYSWNNGATSQTINVAASGVYMVTITDVNGCVGMASQTVTVYNNPIVTITGNTNLCSGNSTTLDAGSFATYAWSSGETTETISVTTSGTYSVTVSDNLGCTGMASQVVTVQTNPSPSIIPNGPTTFCNGGSVLLDAGSYTSYNWNNGATSQTVSTTTSGHFMVTVTDNNGCTGVAMLNVTVNAAPTPNITANGPTTFCDGDSVSLDAGAFVSYNWNTGSTTESITVFGSQPYCVTVTDANGCSGTACTFVIVHARPTPIISGPTTACFGNTVTMTTGSFTTYNWSTGATNSSITTTTSGNYCVTVSNVQGCTASACHSLIVFSSLLPTITPNGPTSFCSNNNVSLDAGQGYSSYSWSNGATTETITVNTSNVYRVTVSNVAGCTGTASQIVTVTPNIVGLSIIGPTSTCGGGNVTLTTGATYGTYLWSNGVTTQSINVAVTGIYYVTVSNGGNCTAVTHQSVTILTSPVPNILPANLANLCGNGNATLTVGATFASYTWSTGAVTQGITINSGGTYSVTVVSSNGCSGMASTTVSGGCNIPTFPAIPTTSIAATSAMANWIQPACHYGYNVRISKHNLNVWVNHTIMPNSHYTFSGLTHNTAYDWQVQTNCNASLTSVSGYSASQTFTTLARLEGEGDAAAISLFNVYPNPASNQATIVFLSDKEETYNLRLIDVTGRVIINQEHTSMVGDNQYQMNLSELAKGIYMVVLQNSDGTLQKRIVVQ